MTGSEKRRFLHHYVEMVVVMLVSMAVLGGIVSGIFVLLGHLNLYHYAAFRAFVMTANMVIGMSVWMRFRGHSFAATAEMAVAMALPFLMLIGPYEADVISAGVLLIGMHALMLPFMFAAMLFRRDDYTRAHKLHMPFRNTVSHA
jgi:hypothetical protein